MASPGRKPSLALASLGIFIVLAVGGSAAASLQALAGFGVQPGFKVEAIGPRVVSVEPPTFEAGVRVGDRLLAIAGQPYLGRRVLGRALANASPGQTLRVRVEREEGGTPRELDVDVPLQRPARPRPAEWVVGLGLGILLPLFCAPLGWIVVFRRPRDGRAWLLLLLLLSFAAPYSSGDVARWPLLVRWPALTLPAFLAPTWGLWMLLFGIYFPERARVDRALPWLKWLFIVPQCAFGALKLILALGASERYDLVTGLVAPAARLERPQLFLGMAAVGGFFALMGMKSGTLPSPDSRRRLRLVWVGATLGLTPMFAVALLAILRGGAVSSGAPAWLLVPALLALPLFPLTLAYVIVVERALDLGVVIRQGLRYALARNAILAVQGLLSVGLVAGALLLAADPGANRPRRITFLAWGVLLVVTLGRLALRARAFVDRRFFREALDTERVLHELGEDVRTMVDTPTLLATVSQRLSEALHAPQVAVLLEGDAGYALAGAHASSTASSVLLSAQAVVVERLRAEGRPLVVYPEDPRHWASDLPDDERRALIGLQSQLLIPLRLKERLLGILSLGPKLSEQPYAPSDLRVLGAVGTQVGLALENGRLMADIAAEAVRRGRLNRELEIAREVQERLFPQELPAVAGLDYDAHCRPARGVGGDYYDFLALSGGRLGLAIGDVSGKGIPAALLMAALQASLRGQASFGGLDLAELMGRVNRLICDTSSSNRYATFFYAQFEPSTRVLQYVNAGHNAPMLLRADGRVERLDQGGPVVGLIEIASYSSAECRLEPGDGLVLYTDGLSEAMSTTDEEWGEERLLETFRSCGGLAARAAVERLVAAADAFASGAPQHDDLTVMVVRVLS